MTAVGIVRDRQTKIVATLGPASSTAEMIEKLMRTGVDVFRLNFSHGSHEDHAARLKTIREIEARVHRPVAVIADLQGPKLRVGTFKSGAIAIERGMKLTFDLNPEPGDLERIPLPHPEVIEALEVGSDILLDDGKVRVTVREKLANGIVTEVMAGSRLSDRKGFNVPDVVLPVTALTDKDRRDLAYALDIGVDWVALSFVQRPEDVAEAKRLIEGRAPVMIKLEKPSALKCLDELIDLADGMMVARGDLGVELPPEKVPPIQKRIVRETRAAGKPVIVATQMLESMITAARPTRAEASDVATAVYDSADAVMLSAETASGDYPVEAVRIMDSIIQEVERDPFYPAIMDVFHPGLEHTANDAITAAAHQAADTVDAAAIVTFTVSGSTTLRATRERPREPVLCLSTNERTVRRMMLSYGVSAVLVEEVHNVDEMTEMARRMARDLGFAHAGERVVITCGIPFATPGMTNVLHLAWV